MISLNSDSIDTDSEAYNDLSLVYNGSSISHHVTDDAEVRLKISGLDLDLGYNTKSLKISGFDFF